jgi:hypothetical protein
LGVEYRRTALHLAGKTLDAADGVLGSWLRRSWRVKAPTPEQLRQAIEALARESWWDDLLGADGLAGNADARAAAKAVAWHVARIDASDLRAADLESLRRDIQALRQEITFAERHVKDLPPQRAWLYVSAANRIAWGVTVGVAAASAANVASGGDAVSMVAGAALAATVTAVMGQLEGGISRRQAAHTLAGRLQKTHRDLIEALRTLAFSLPTLAGPGPPGEATARSIALAVGFLASHAQQLASACWPQWRSDAYRRELEVVRQLVDDLRAVADGQDHLDGSQAAEDLLKAATTLDGFTVWTMKAQAQGD